MALDGSEDGLTEDVFSMFLHPLFKCHLQHSGPARRLPPPPAEGRGAEGLSASLHDWLLLYDADGEEIMPAICTHYSFVSLAMSVSWFV